MAVSLLTGTAFSKGGPVQRYFHRIDPDAPYRLEQAQGAALMAENIERGYGSDKVPILPIEMGPGTGKSDAITMNAAFTVLAYPGARVIISVQTQDQRRFYAKHEDALNEMAAMTYTDRGLPPPRRIKIAERVSFTSFGSPRQARAMLEAVNRKEYREDPSVEELCRAYAEFILDPSTSGLIEDFVHLPCSDGRLPLGLSASDLWLTREDQNEARSAPGVPTRWQQAEALRDKAADADILVVTHAMLIMHSITGGALLDNRPLPPAGEKLGRKRGHHRDTLIIDEAHCLADAGAGALVTRLNLDRLEDTLLLVSRSKALGSALPLLVDLQSTVRLAVGDSIRGIIRRSDTALAQDFEASAAALVGEIEAGLDTLKTMPEYKFETDLLSEMVGRLKILRQVHLPVPVSATAAQRFRAEHVALDIENVMSGANHSNGTLILRSTRHKGRLASMWSNQADRRHDFASIILTSGTMTGIGGINDWNWFMTTLGLWSEQAVADWAARTNKPVFPHHSIRAPVSLVTNTHGVITRVVQPYVDIDNITILPTDQNQSNWINPEHVAYTAGAVEHWLQRCGDRRAILLCQSHAFREAVVARLLTLPGVAEDKLIVQAERQHPSALIPQFQATTGSIWISVAWEGYNLVDEHGKTLIDTVMIGRLPLPPPQRGEPGDPVRTFRDGIDEAFHKVIQGIYRALRSPDDRCEVWFLDPRYPLDFGLCQELRLPMKTHSAFKPFAEFGRVLRPRSDVRNAPKKFHRAVFHPDTGAGYRLQVAQHPY